MTHEGFVLINVDVVVLTCSTFVYGRSEWHSRIYHDMYALLLSAWADKKRPRHKRQTALAIDITEYLCWSWYDPKKVYCVSSVFLFVVLKTPFSRLFFARHKHTLSYSQTHSHEKKQLNQLLERMCSRHTAESGTLEINIKITAL